jgi:PIN domain nuclease of toxin-antitoxin system
MIVLDTSAMIFDALEPDRMGRKARRELDAASAKGTAACSDISLWEIAMLAAKGRLDPGTDVISFIDLVVMSRNLRVLPITPEVAHLSASYRGFTHADPADRIIASTALFFDAPLLTPDRRLRAVKGLRVLWG